MDLNDVKAGKYELVVKRWDQITSKPGAPLDFVRHRRGDVIDHNVEDARRLVKAGAVKPRGKATKSSQTDTGGDAGTSGGDDGGGSTGGDAGTSGGDGFDPTVGGNIKPTLAYVGEDKARAQAMLDLEATKPEKDQRPSLVEQLQVVISG